MDEEISEIAGDEYQFSLDIMVRRFPFAKKWRALARVGGGTFTSGAFPDALAAIHDSLAAIGRDRDNFDLAVEQALTRKAKPKEIGA